MSLKETGNIQRNLVGKENIHFSSGELNM